MRTIRDCNVCVIGGAGFLGSHLVNHLIEDRGCKVLVIDNLCAGRREFVNPKAEFFHHDITSSENWLLLIFKTRRVRYVLNYAAMPYIPDSFAHPVRVSDVNYMGALKVINAAQEAGCEGILQVSSAEIYGEGHTELSAVSGANPHVDRITEEELVRPHSSYGAAKASIDAMVQVRWKEAKTPCIALRQFNCVGERETHPYVVPEIISQLQREKQTKDRWEANNTAKYIGETPVVKLGNNSFRDFLYAGDAVRIAVELLERGEFGQVYNLGSETGIKIYDLAKLIGKLMGFADVEVVRDPARVRPWEIWHLQSDNSKIKALWTGGDRDADLNLILGGWEMVRLEEALRKTIDYYNANNRKWCWEQLCDTISASVDVGLT